MDVGISLWIDHGVWPNVRTRTHAFIKDTSYKAISPSRLTKVSDSTFACAISIRSKGSW